MSLRPGLSLLDGLSVRSSAPERMDDPELRGATMATALRRIGSFTRVFGGVEAVAREMERTAGRSLLDVGAGDMALLGKLRSRVPDGALLVGLDHHPGVIGVVSGGTDSGTIPLRADGMALPFPDASFDLVASTLTLHHLTDAEAVRFLKEMGRVARHRVYVWDLDRTHTAFLGAQFLGRSVWRRDELVREDAVQSVRRAFRPGEVRALAAAAGLSGVQVRALWPARWELRAAGGTARA